MRNNEINLKIESLGVKSHKSTAKERFKNVQNVSETIASCDKKKIQNSNESTNKSHIRASKARKLQLPKDNNGDNSTNIKLIVKKEVNGSDIENQENICQKKIIPHKINKSSKMFENSQHIKRNKSNKMNKSCFANQQNIINSKNNEISPNPSFMKIKTNDEYLNELLKKKDILIQSEFKYEPKKKEYNMSSPIVKSSEDTSNSSDDINTMNIIEQYQKKQKMKIEKKKKILLQKRKNELIKKITYKDAETQVFIDDFTKYYSEVKSSIENIVQDVLNSALKSLYQEQELNQIQNNIGYYENIRIQKYGSLENAEKSCNAFYDETQQKIKDRIALKNKILIIIKKKIAFSKAKNNINHIIQKNVDSFSLSEYLPTKFEKGVNLIVLPWLTECILYLVNVKTKIVNNIVSEMIEQTLISRSELHKQNSNNII
ncbi:conserved Plasmodium protein, unknown function [Plasmodium yoelii]|uniref:Uncharacterized protein n=1 Tax=Plasmodium yoelii TaxID=5861 RepID=A0A078KFR7_PLAYE|nr:conserved Plasmodium protein, unknown function [Plasmodium yoelii]CDU85244.1 conserved Plasmodium protein, unknown function [Plasmodium yoelii]VTZ79139.1 conserved Plasmodium protein, unknown function [Plasmodium yoelii]|eukprot:XP_022813417.1 conserved Plasmodium protein, unknown function [Plasmodium yoelii]